MFICKYVFYLKKKMKLRLLLDFFLFILMFGVNKLFDKFEKFINWVI